MVTKTAEVGLVCLLQNYSNIPSTWANEVFYFFFDGGSGLTSTKGIPIFEYFFSPLQRGKYLEGCRVLDKYYIASVDGSGYFSSDKICCPGCLRKENKKGNVRYEHQIVQAAIVHPGKRQVIPLAPEEVKNTDGTNKQDCEINAGKRLIKKIRQSHPKLPLIILQIVFGANSPSLRDSRKKI